MFAIFCGDTYYPYGGVSDLCNIYDTEEEAYEAAKSILENNDWLEIAKISEEDIELLERRYKVE